MAAMRLIWLLVAPLLLASPAVGDDGAASIAAGGLVLMKREPRITMAREVLSISERKVEVEYEFRNDSEADITTEVAFPIPAYNLCCGERDPTKQGFDDFRLWVNGTPAHFRTETRAIVNHRDITEVLQSLHIDIASFGHYSQTTERSADLDRLTSAQRARISNLKAIGISFNRLEPLWTVQKKYHWTQNFPPHSTIHIRHEYTPWIGNSNSIDTEWLRTGKNAVQGEELPTVCPTSTLLHLLRREIESNKHAYAIAYVDFILTTANTWKGPIEDFTLKVDRSRQTDFVSFCWNGSVSHTRPNQFIAERKNFVPSTELRIGFLKGYKPE